MRDCPPVVTSTELSWFFVDERSHPYEKSPSSVPLGFNLILLVHGRHLPPPVLHDFFWFFLPLEMSQVQRCPAPPPPQTSSPRIKSHNPDTLREPLLSPGLLFDFFRSLFNQPFSIPLPPLHRVVLSSCCFAFPSIILSPFSFGP